MTRTVLDLGSAVAQKLGIIDSAANVPAEDQALIARVYNDLLEEWKERGVAYWAAGEIPNSVFQAVVLIIAGAVSTDYGMAEPVETDETGAQAPITAIGWRKLRRHMAKPASGSKITADYF